MYMNDDPQEGVGGKAFGSYSKSSKAKLDLFTVPVLSLVYTREYSFSQSPSISLSLPARCATSPDTLHPLNTPSSLTANLGTPDSGLYIPPM
jgi:hypothetical protein